MRTRHVALLLGALVLLTFAAFAGSARAADGFTAGSAGLGDPFFPNAGNGTNALFSNTTAYDKTVNGELRCLTTRPATLMPRVCRRF